jgi:hypothetical protein
VYRIDNAAKLLIIGLIVPIVIFGCFLLAIFLLAFSGHPNVYFIEVSLGEGYIDPDINQVKEGISVTNVTREDLAPVPILLSILDEMIADSELWYISREVNFTEWNNTQIVMEKLEVIPLEESYAFWAGLIYFENKLFLIEFQVAIP